MLLFSGYSWPVTIAASMTLVHLFLVSIALYFGAYTLLDLATTSTGNLDALTVATLTLTIALPALVLWLFRRTGPSLEKMRQDCLDCPAIQVLGVITACAAFRVYAASIFGNHGALTDEELPYWFTTSGMLTSALVFPAAFCSWGKFTASSGWSRLLWVCALAVSTALILGAGRRAFITLLIVIGFDVLRRRRLGFRSIALIALSVPVLLTASNLFQAYREASYRGIPVDVSNVEGSAVENALTLEHTLSNLENRMAIWRYNYELIYAHIYRNASLGYGSFLVSGLPAFIPSVVHGRKTRYDAEEAVLDSFRLDKYDRPSNLFAFTYADFGLASVFVSPALIIFFCVACGFVLTRLRDPFLRMTLMGFAVAYALNMETGYLAPIQITRDFLLIGALYWMALQLKRFAVHAVRLQHQ